MPRIPEIYSLDGNIGSGKSTFLDYLSNHLGKIEFGRSIVYLKEPVDVWESIKDSSGDTILKKFYENQKRYSFSFQMMAYISRLSLLQKAVRKNPDSIIITERCVHTDKNVFAKMLYDSGMIEEIEYKIYLQWFDNFIKKLPLSGIIYMNTPPTVCHERIKKRNRTGESIPLEYLVSCDKYHKEWMKIYPDKTLLFLNGKLEKSEETYETYLNKVRSFIPALERRWSMPPLYSV